ncbi:prolyl 4-hydroxylase subunit alpha-1 [Patella vulgata]|uniref:prolyl 4-hydroxylase subunit alpha-1 n=1 Tax=Patella vulgata TaxID=6465 RepID=UPI00217FD065|nr:prolyl 4-hydroxylase subunit alpha-1 [Patella vulgata]
MKSVLLLLGILIPVYGQIFINQQKWSLTLTTQANLEKIYHVEEELLQSFSIFLRQEQFYHKLDNRSPDDADEEEEEHENAHAHNGSKSHLEDVKKNIELLEDAKRVHRIVSNRVMKYILHPINVYHMMRRVRTINKAAMDVFENVCKAWNMPDLKYRLQNINRSVPTEEHFENVAYDLVMLQHIYNLTENSLFSGNLFNHSSLDPLSPRDIYDIARIAYKRQDYYYAIRWARYLTELFNTYDVPDDRYGFSMKNLFAIMSSSYYPLKQYKSAMISAQMILRLDPDNKLAQVNEKFFERLIDQDKKIPLRRIPPGDKTRRKYEAMCRGTLKKPAKLAKQYKCKYQRGKNLFIYHKMEVMNLKPKILVFHDVFNQDTGDAVAYLGYKPLSEASYKNRMYFESPHFTAIPRDRTRSQWVKALTNRLDELPMASIKPYRKGILEVRNIGFEGMYYDISDAKNWVPKLGGGNTASMFAFLKDVEAGGEMVFPYHRVRITPRLGSVVYYLASRSFMMVCPVAYGTEWLSVMSFYEEHKYGFCRDHDQP